MTEEALDEFARFDIPEQGNIVNTTGHDIATIWRKSDAEYGSVMAGEPCGNSAGTGIPESSDTIVTCRSHKVLIMRECHVIDRYRKPVKTLRRHTCVDSPESYCTIIATGYEHAAIGSQGNRIDSPIMPLEFADQFTIEDVPEAGGTIFTGC